MNSKILCNWLNANKISLNASKTEYLNILVNLLNMISGFL